MSSRRGSSSAIWATCASCRPVATALAPKCGWKRPPSATDGSCLPEDTLRLLPSCSQSASHGLPSSRDYSHVVDRRSPAHMSKRPLTASAPAEPDDRSEEHTSELQSLMRISYAVFCLKKKKTTTTHHTPTKHNNA